MITIFNRKELLITTNLQKQDKICTLLSNHHIAYRVDVTNRISASPFSAGPRARTGSFGVDQTAVYEYKIYVKKSQYGKAQALLKNCS